MRGLEVRFGEGGGLRREVRFGEGGGVRREVRGLEVRFG